ncbi:MAG: DUF2171 domain-containing protein [Nitrososphaeraceae archaeon]
MCPDIISWDKAMGKEVKSSDKKGVGKIESVTTEYIQTKDGLVSKKYYFIPKQYIQQFDGDSVWVSLTKDDLKGRFEREDVSEIRAEEFQSQSTTATKTTSATTTEKGTDMVEMPWEKVIGKKARSSDSKDLGKVESIGPHFVEVDEGIVRHKRYFIPKYYVEGFDGDNLHAAVTKDEIKNKYERDSPPSESELQNQEYLERKSKVESLHPQFLHGIPFMAKEPGVSLKDQQSGQTLNIPWEEVIHKRVKTTDNVDIGDVEKVGNEFIVVREGVAKVHIYYIPKPYISNYDGSSLYISAPSGLVSAKFERETEPTPEEIRTLGREAESRT